MKVTILLAVILFVVGLNYAVFLHHDAVYREMEKRNMDKMQLISQEKEEPYTFHYAGKEKWSNVFALYRLNKETGEILRYSYTIYEKDKDGTQQYDSVSVLNMETGEESSNISSISRMMLRLYYDEQARIEKEKNENEERIEENKTDN